MDLSIKSSLKFKLLTFDELVINIDRLSRFKLPEISFNRVFRSVIFRCLIYPSYSKAEIEKLKAEDISYIVKKIWNESVKNCCKKTSKDDIAYAALNLIINNSFKNIEVNSKKLINTKLDIAPVLNVLDYEKAPVNLKFLVKVSENIKSKSELNYKNLVALREKFALKFPVEKLLIVEGITEEILLPVFADKINLNFDKNGIYVHGAGGKSKSPAVYMQLKDKLKIPVFLLFDFDAKEICTSLSKVLDKKDKIILIEKGEFEDILSLNLIKRSLNKEYLPAAPLIKSDLHIYKKMCENIENFYKSRHLGEFKKSKLSKIIAQNITYDSDVTDDIKIIISSIIK